VVLQNGLFDGVTNLNRIAAIFAVTEDRQLEDKNQEVGETFMITQKDRAKLWMSYPGHKSQTWICAAEKQILEDFAAEIKFVQVLGTDNLQPDNRPISNSLMRATIVTDVS
jgi:hypothetical protein